MWLTGSSPGPEKSATSSPSEVGVVRFPDLSEAWKTKFSAKYPEGRACQKCGKARALEECSFSKNGHDRFVLDRFCPSCRTDYWRKQGISKGTERRPAAGHRRKRRDWNAGLCPFWKWAGSTKSEGNARVGWLPFRVPTMFSEQGAEPAATPRPSSWVWRSGRPEDDAARA